MRNYRTLIFTSILVTSLIMPTTSYAANFQLSIDPNKNLSVINLIFSLFRANDETIVIGSEEIKTNIDKEYLQNTPTLNNGSKEISTKEMEKYNKNYDKHDYGYDYDRDHDHDRDGRRDHHRERDRDCDQEREPDPPKESCEIWRDWYGKGDWDWFWKWWGK